MSDKSKSTAFLLCYFLGLFGAHRFYVGRWKTGVLMLLTLGGLVLWWVVDSVLLAAGVLRDGDGQPLRTGPPDPGNPAAGFWVRLAAFSIDLVILNLIISVLMMALGLILPLIGLGALGATGGDLSTLGEQEQAAMGMAMVGGLLVLSVVPLVIYFAIQHASRHQATVGKRCFDIYVTTADGGRMGLGRGVWRALCYLLSSIPLYLGFVMAGFTRDKRALHDMLAGTRVRYVSQAGELEVSHPAAAEPAFSPSLPEPEPSSFAVAEGTVEKTSGAGTALIVVGALLLAGAAAVALL